MRDDEAPEVEDDKLPPDKTEELLLVIPLNVLPNIDGGDIASSAPFLYFCNSFCRLKLPLELSSGFLALS